MIISTTGPTGPTNPNSSGGPQNYGSSNAADIQKILDESLKSAKAHFEKSNDGIFNKLLIWAALCFICICTFFIFIMILFNVKFPCFWTWQIIYFTAIRLSAITALWALTAFCFKMLRSYLYIYERNKHRLNIINSISGFGASIFNDNQRNRIVANLIESISNFGNTGLISKESESKTIQVDLIEKLFKKRE